MYDTWDKYSFVVISENPALIDEELQIYTEKSEHKFQMRRQKLSTEGEVQFAQISDTIRIRAV